jgi:3-oxoadipate enol-lactonase
LEVTVKLTHRFDGPADAPVLILGSSLGTELEMWDASIPELAANWRVLRYNHRGHGGSGSEATASVGDLAADVLALADSYGIEKFVVGGVSLGGAIGLWLAVNNPERVDGLVMSCSSARFGDPAMWTDRAALVRADGMAPIVDATLGRWFTPAFQGGPEAARVREMFLRTDADGYAECCTALSTYDLRSSLGKVTVPALIIGGEDDPSTPPAHARELAEGIPGASLLLVDQAAHLANIEQAAAVTTAIAGFLKKQGLEKL